MLHKWSRSWAAQCHLVQSRYNHDMSELNPYESPQTEIKPTSNEKPPAPTKGSEVLGWIVHYLVELQVVTGILTIAFALLREPLRELFGEWLRISAPICLGLGVILLIIATAQKYTKLLIFELLVLAVFFSLQMIHAARH